MTRRIPIFEYNEELKTSKHKVYKSLIDGVTEAIKTDKEEIVTGKRLVILHYIMFN